ncbi:MAG: hypothetical protein OXI24_07520 [Candidatus Poribacteria bacterium]|nr:hypothetical protein [Candidatus Poribacteria bacterium]
MNEISFGVLGAMLGCSVGLAGIFLGVRYSKVQSFGRLPKPVYLGIASGLMLGVVLPATMFSVLLPEASWLATLRWVALIALALIGAIPMLARRRASGST